jgi:hypothetical protein
MIPLFRLDELEKDAVLYQQVQRLHQVTVFSRWALVAGFWLTMGAFSLWQLRNNLQLMREYFTWSALRYGLRYHYPSALGLAFCVGLTFAVLLWQSRNILWGLPVQEQQRLVRNVLKIREQGKSHPLWQWVCLGQKLDQGRWYRQDNQQ